MLPKVRPLASPLMSVLLLIGALAGCDPRSKAGGDGPPPKAPAPVGDRFGDPYDIVLSKIPAAPAEPPALLGDSLFVHVAYGGGCADHTFTLRHRTARDTTRLWLVHDANGDGCEAYVYDDLRLHVSSGALRDARVVVVLNPQGGPPHLLHWGDA